VTAARTYLDHNASAPLRPAAREAVVAALDAFGNASSIHAEGRRARALVDEAREAVAALVNARPAEVVFTSGATESNVWALSQPWRRIAFAGIEHDSVRAPATHIAAERQAETVALPVDANGQADVAAAGSGPDLLIALQMANNETGVLQDVTRAGLWATGNGATLHCDAAQAPGRVPIDFPTFGAATLSLSAHKMGGPKGVGALVISGNTPMVSLLPGGGQELRRRSGTENVAAIAGFGAAANAALDDLKRAARVAHLRDRLEAEILRVTPGAVVIGAAARRLPNTSSIAVPGVSAETLVIKFDLAGIAISAGSACSSGKVSESPVLSAMGLPAEIVRGAVRISLGADTTDDDIAAFVAVWRRIHGGASLAA
jgi:cysteine desulfurase